MVVLQDKISVLMCVYNTCTEYLSEAIDSILGQSYSNIEFVIVDDGSDDGNTQSLLQKYAASDDRILLIKNDINIGLTKSLNVGLKRCTGKYVARMDADDISLIDRLQLQYDYMEQHPEISMLGANIIEFSGDRVILDTSKNLSVFDCEEHRINSLFEHSGPPHPTFFIRKSFIDEHNICYCEDILKAQDYGLMAYIYMNGGKIYKLGSSLLKYRVHDNQITATAGSEQKMYQEKVSESILQHFFPQMTDTEIHILSTFGSDKIEETEKGYRLIVDKLLASEGARQFDSAKLTTLLNVKLENKIGKINYKKFHNKVLRHLKKRVKRIKRDIYEQMTRLMPDKAYLKKTYKERVGKELNLDSPRTFCEKIQWLKLYDHKEEYHKWVDKYEAKKYVTSIIGEEYIIPTIGIWNKYDHIDYDSLPDKFVLKCTHDSGSIVIVDKKIGIDKTAIKQKIDTSLKNNYYWYGREWVYKGVRPRIIAEPLINELTDNDLVDYKFFCFNGKPRFCQVIANRFTDETIDFFDMDWKHQDFCGLGLNEKNAEDYTKLSRPQSFDMMKKTAAELSANTKFLRVDFYDVNGKMLFGEMTFYPASGMAEFYPSQWNDIIGDMIEL